MTELSTAAAADLSAAPKSPAADLPKLAAYGGARAVTERFREKWKQMTWRDAMPILANMFIQRNTIATGTGPLVRFEQQFAALCGSRHALCMNSGTASLHSAYFAVGVKPGDEVIVPAYTFFASAGPIMQCGATPVFCDIDPRTLTIDPDEIERRITKKTSAICVVHVWGNPADMDRIMEIANRHDLPVIEDCSHAHGAQYKGKTVGSMGTVGCFSLQGSKAVSGGEAGIAVTDDPVLFDRMLALGHNVRVEGGQAAGTFKVDGHSFGLKYRPHLFGILLATGSLSRLPELNRRRQKNYDILAEELDGCTAVDVIETHEDCKRGGFLEFILRYHPEHAGNWPIETFANAVKAEGVPIYVDRYSRQGLSSPTLHHAPVFAEIDYSKLGGAIGAPRGATPPAAKKVDLPVTERLCNELLAMPAFTRVSPEFVHQVGKAIKKVAKCAPHIRDFRTGSYE